MSPREYEPIYVTHPAKAVFALLLGAVVAPAVALFGGHGTPGMQSAPPRPAPVLDPDDLPND